MSKTGVDDVKDCAHMTLESQLTERSGYEHLDTLSAERGGEGESG